MFAMSWLRKYVLPAALVYASAHAQTSSACDPTKKSGCPADPALGTSESWDFTKGAFPSSWTPTGGVPTYDSNGVSFTVAKSGDSPTLVSNFYLMFGQVDVVMKVAPGQGIVSAFVLLSDDLDEIDYEWTGPGTATAQTNYFVKGGTPPGVSTGASFPNPGCETAFHKYTVTWTAEQITWFIDGTAIRTITAAGTNNLIPQTPSQIKLGIWSGGDPANAPGTINWAGGVTNYTAGPYSMVVQSVDATDYSTGTSYSYNGESGSWSSIVAAGGKVNGDKTSSTPASPSPASPAGGTSTSTSSTSSSTGSAASSGTSSGTSSSAGSSASSGPAGSTTGVAYTNSTSCSGTSTVTIPSSGSGSSTSCSGTSTLTLTSGNGTSGASPTAGSSPNGSPIVTYTTQVVTSFTTFCPEATTLTHNSVTYTVTEATTLTITNCPCTLTSAVTVSPVPASVAPTPSTTLAVSTFGLLSSSAAPVASSPVPVSGAPAPSSPAVAPISVPAPAVSSAAPASVATSAPLVPLGTVIGQSSYANTTYAAATAAPTPVAASSAAPVASIPVGSSAAAVGGTPSSNLTTSASPAQVTTSAASALQGTASLWAAASAMLLALLVL
ncbi:MAG: hypothetical protein M1838_003015 [Thelocarpon superellum]|nr:MAG: hypothetical protein M1838_003015 [Thelocarpon superellum]